MFRSWIQDENGQAITEYGMVIGLLAVVAIGSLVLMRDDITRMFGTIATQVDSAADGVSGAD